jgi:uncharacterized membrane protein YqjE
MDASPQGPAGSARATATNQNGHHGMIDLARVAVEDTIKLVQQEIQLAKIEIAEMLKSNLKAAIFLVGAATCGLLFFIFLLVFAAFIIPAHALVAGIETAVFLVLTILFGLVGKSFLKIGPPTKTITTLKEDAEWAKQVLKRNGK